MNYIFTMDSVCCINKEIKIAGERERERERERDRQTDNRQTHLWSNLKIHSLSDELNGILIFHPTLDQCQGNHYGSSAENRISCETHSWERPAHVLPVQNISKKRLSRIIWYFWTSVPPSVCVWEWIQNGSPLPLDAPKHSPRSALNPILLRQMHIMPGQGL